MDPLDVEVSLWVRALESIPQDVGDAVHEDHRCDNLLRTRVKLKAVTLERALFCRVVCFLLGLCLFL
jgi:hypothetical protein